MRLGCWPAGSTAIVSGMKTTTTTKTTGEVQNRVRNLLRRSAEGECPHLPAVRCLREVGKCLPCVLLLRSLFFHHSSRLGSDLFLPVLSLFGPFLANYLDSASFQGSTHSSSSSQCFVDGGEP